MKQNTDYIAVNTSYDPLKTILAQTEDQYPFATVFAQEESFYSFRQEQMTNYQWYERFITKVEAGDAIGVDPLVYVQEASFYSFRQEQMTNTHCTSAATRRWTLGMQSG
jgi:hypothetical protein